MNKLKTVYDIKLKEYKLEYKFQEELTKKLDIYDGEFDQEVLNEIVLWKVNRYAKFDNDTIKLINILEKTSCNLDLIFTNKILEKLLNTKGVRIAMASTILRFKNPSIYQIIDQRVYRVIYGVSMPRLSKNVDAIKLYLDYLEKLKYVCNKYKINFSESDRILYNLDKEINSGIKIK